MSEVQNYLLAVNSDQQRALDIARKTAQALETKQFTLIGVVQSLSDYINDEDTTLRSRATDYLSQVIGQLHTSFLSRQQIQVLLEFLCNRIEDAGALSGLRKLAASERFNADMAILTFRALLEHYHDLQVRPQAQRLETLELLNCLMSKHRSTLKQLEDEAINGITALVNGEKDPRNLMIIFSILKVVMVEWEISAHAEPLFDSVFCYFPITFRPPPNDPYGITAQDLKKRLRDCISASGDFAPYAFPQLIEKLDATSPNVKKDVMQTISACVMSYGLAPVSNYSLTLWDSMKFEIFNAQEEDLANEAVISLQAIAIRLSHDLESTDPKTHLARFLRSVTKECNAHLQEPESKQAKPAGQILSALGTASPVAFHLIVKAVVPLLNTLYDDTDDISRQRALLEVLVQLLDSAIAVFGTLSMPTPSTTVENPLLPFKDRLFEVASQALMSTPADEVSFRVAALRVLLRLCLLRNYLRNSEIGIAIQYFDEIILSEDPNGKDNLKQESIEALVRLSRIKSELIMEITFPAFMSKLPDSYSSDSSSDRWDCFVTLEGLAQLSVEKFVSDTLIRRLMNKLDVVLQHKGTSKYPQAILSTLHYILSQRDLSHEADTGAYYEKIVVGLISRVVSASTGRSAETALNEDSTLEVLGRLVTLIVRALDEHKQRSVALQVYTLFVDEGVFAPVPFRKDVPLLQRSTMILSTALIAGLGRLGYLQFGDIGNGSRSKLLSELVRLALTEETSFIRQAILRQIGLLINKFMSLEETNEVVSMIRSIISGLLETTMIPDNAIRVLFWEAKSLILRLAHTKEVLDCLLALLSDPRYGSSSAHGFSLLLAPDEALSRENGCNVRLLAKQKVFSICAPVIAGEFRKDDTKTKSNYLIALSGILKDMPTDVVLSETETLLPLLLQSLDLEDSEVKVATIKTLTVISHKNPNAVEGRFKSLISRLLNLVTCSNVNTTSVRHHALKCLQGFPRGMRGSTLLPHKNTVTRGLVSVLDDAKRHVRKEAVECRSAWFSLDEPQSD